MRIVNEKDFEYALLQPLTHGRADPTTKYKSWLCKSALPWLLKNSPEFHNTFLSLIHVRKSSLFQSSSGAASESFFYLGLNNERTRAYLEGEFDVKDAKAGILYAFVEKQKVLPWIYSNFPFLLDTRDFFDHLLEEKPDLDLRKYTLATLPDQVAVWKAAEAARHLVFLQEQAAREAARAAAEAELGALHGNFAGNLLESYSATTEQARLEYLAKAWDLMKEGEDYNLLGFCHKYHAIALLSPRALDWESAYKGNCLSFQSYKRKLRDKNTVFVSFREKDNIGRSVITAEYEKDGKGGFMLMQQEQWGYKIPVEMKTELATQHDEDTLRLVFPETLKSIPESLLSSSSTRAGLEFVINRTV